MEKFIEPFPTRVYLSSPTMHGDELKYIKEAYYSNWMSCVGRNLDELSQIMAGMADCAYAVALSSGTAALHLAAKLAGVQRGEKVFCSDLTFAATVNPIVYEGAVPVFIDSERDTWNMDPAALEKAFELYPEVNKVVVAHLYGTPCKMDEILDIAQAHGALVIEDAAEALGATYRGRKCGSFGMYNCISFNGNKIITGTTGGMLLTDDGEAAELARKWSTQSREPAAWYQHEELGYNYRMSNVVAGIVRGQVPYLEEHIAQKRAIYERYRDGLDGLPISMNPFDSRASSPNYWLSCMLIDRDAMCKQSRSDLKASYASAPGRSCPTEILEALAAANAEGRPIWKPMHMQPLYRDNPFVAVETPPVGEDIFERGLCLPSDNKMTPQQQMKIIGIIRDCFA